MKQDRELLEAAAKAVGLNTGTDEGSYDDLKWWNPITSVADRYELCKKLDLCLDFEIKAVYNKCGMANWSSDEDEGRVIVEFAGRRDEKH